MVKETASEFPVKMNSIKKKWIVGIDEAGRGPLAGPVYVGVFATPVDFDERLIEDARDSKQINARERMRLYEYVKTLQNVRYAVAYSTNTHIDTKGIVPAVESALKRALESISVRPQESLILLDGGLTAPKKYVHQETYVRGDALKKVISVASILAKVSRDRHMEHLSADYPAYGFESHKGYGTQKHREAIKTHGLTCIHRATFCKNIIV